MASKNFSGTLIEPTGELANNDKIMFAQVTTTGEVIAGSVSIVKIGDDGTYDFDLQYGTISISTYNENSRRWIHQGTVTINSDTLVNTLPGLLNAFTPTTPAIVQQLEQILADGQQIIVDAQAQADSASSSALAAEGFKDLAEQAATASANSANQSALNAVENGNVIKAILIAQGLSEEYGYFADGFTLNDPLDVGIDASFQFWKYIGAETLPYAVPAGTDPSSGDWELIEFNSASNIINDDETTSQHTHDLAKDLYQNQKLSGNNTKATSELKPIRQIHTGYELSTLNSVGTPYLKLNSDPSNLNFIEIIFSPIDHSTTSVIVDMDVLEGVEGTDFTFNLTTMDDLNRTNAANKSISWAYSNGKFIITFPTLTSTPPFMAVSIRALTGQNAALKINSMKAIDSDYKLIASTVFDIIDSLNGGYATVTDNSTYKQRIIALGDESYVYSNHIINVSVNGSESIFNPPYSYEYWHSTVELMGNMGGIAKKIVFDEGDYYRYRSINFLVARRDLTLIGVGNVRFLCGFETNTNLWESVAASAGVLAFRVLYDSDANPDAAIRAGTKQPFVSSVLTENNSSSVKPYNNARVNSVAEVTSSPYRSYYDGTYLYFSFDSSKLQAYIAVAECDNGFVHEDPANPNNVNIVNISALYTKVKVFNLSPTIYTPRLSGGKFISLHNCKAIGSYAGVGFGINGIDSEMFDCYADSCFGDGFNYHYHGVSLIVDCSSKSCGDDSMSHHEYCVGEVHNFKSLYPASAHSVPAFGAKVVHFNCQGIAATEGLSGKNYQSSFASLSGQGSNSYAEYNNCKTIGAGSDYSAVSQEAGRLSELVINKPVTQDDINITYSGSESDLSVYGDFTII